MKLGGDKMFWNTRGGNILRSGAGFPLRYGNGGRITPQTFADYRSDSREDISEQYKRAGESVHLFSIKLLFKYSNPVESYKDKRKGGEWFCPSSPWLQPDHPVEPLRHQG